MVDAHVEEGGLAVAHVVGVRGDLDSDHVPALMGPVGQGDGLDEFVVTPCKELQLDS
jgi:hypothetical protein